MTPQQQVFNCSHTRHLILTEFVKHKDLTKYINTLIEELIKDNWFKYCKCHHCTIKAHHYLMDLPPLIN